MKTSPRPLDRTGFQRNHRWSGCEFVRLAILAPLAFVIACGAPVPVGDADAANADAANANDTAARSDAPTDGPGPVTTIPDAEVLRYCILLVGCNYGPDSLPVGATDRFATIEAGGGPSIESCFLEVRGAIDNRRLTARAMTVLHCIGASDRCETAARCGVGDSGATFCASHPDDACDGERAVRCSTTQEVADCAAVGATCRAAGDGGIARCVVAACPASADGGTTTVCDGDRALVCSDFHQLSVSCEAFRPGSHCDPAADPSYFGCAPPPPECSEESRPPSCDGDALVQCRFGRVVRTVCADGLGCRLDGSRAECVNVPCPGGDRCDAGVITTCLAGRIERVDCTALGFSSCTTFGFGANCVR